LLKVDFREYHHDVNSENFAWSARRILVVEDEAPVRELLMRVLQDSGYLVAAGQDELPGTAEFLEKPWTPHEMLDRVRTVLARG
jgi:DNA-binding response OmpR family regulator